jgi:predicted regulator of Ras-like GTPase activity (Roadblock/LC7/MglB family)
MEDIVRTCELEALAVVTQSNAEEIAFFTDMDTNVDIFCALAAASLDTATKVTNKMNHGSVLELVVIGESGYTIMSPVADQYILIGAGKDFYSLGKTILILREKVKEIPLTLTDKRATTTKRKACSHFCQNDELYCCVCSNIKQNCDICQTSVQHKQAEQKKILEAALEKVNSLDEVSNKIQEKSTTFAFTTENKSEEISTEEGQSLFNKVLIKIENLEDQEKVNSIKSEKKTKRKTNSRKKIVTGTKKGIQTKAVQNKKQPKKKKTPAKKKK